MKHFCRAIVLGLATVFALPSCSNPGDETTAPAEPVTTQTELRNGMRKLWTEHVLWTRVYIIDDIAGLADTKAATHRLFQNQVDLGNAIKPFYGSAAGNHLTSLLKANVVGATAVLEAAKTGDERELASAKAIWHVNADEIAKFWSSANPHLTFAATKMMMNAHLDLTLREATARLDGRWTDDVKAYDEVVANIQMMADALTEGISAQFPTMILEDAKPPGERVFDLTMRSLWEDQVMWMRDFLIDDLAGLPARDASLARLLQSPVDIGDAIKPFYSDAAGFELTELLREHVLLAAEIVDDAKRPMARSAAPATSKLMDAWYANAEVIADFLAEANPRFDKAELRAMMKTHLDQTLAEATARLEMHWRADVVAYDHVEDHTLSVADALARASTSDSR